MKLRYTLVLLALLSVVGMYFLPKAVLSSGQNPEVAQAKQSPEAHPDMAQNTGTAASFESQIATISQAENPADSLRLLSEAIETYQKQNRYDSAAQLAAHFAEQTGQFAYLALAAESYYAAFTYAVKAERVALFSEKAQLFLKKVLAEKPDMSDFKVKLGMTYVGANKPMQGVKLIKEVLENEPENRSALYSLGVLSMQSGQHEKALQRFKTLRPLEEDDTQVAFYMALCYKALKKNGQAKQLFNHVLENTDNEDIKSTVQNYLSEL